MKIIVTGGAALIGSHLTEALLSKGHRVTVIDNLYSNVNYVPVGAEFHKIDLRTDLRALIAMRFYEPKRKSDGSDGSVGSLHDADILYHLACRHGGRGYVDTHEVDCFDNLSLDSTVFRMCAEAGVKKVVYMSSACAYPIDLQNWDSRIMYPLSEPTYRLSEVSLRYDDLQKPDGAYGWAKLMGEMSLNARVKANQFKGVIVRGFTVYGPRMKMNHSVLALLAKSIAKQDPFEVWGDGKQIRNWTYVEDTVGGIMLAAEQDGGVYNVGSENVYRVDDLLRIMWNILGWRPNEVKYLTDKPTGPMYRLCDATKIKALGWSEQFDLYAGISRTLQWYEQNKVSEDKIEALLTE
jgi:nucleoside-diphosphate-sugar epimerase